MDQIKSIFCGCLSDEDEEQQQTLEQPQDDEEQEQEGGSNSEDQDDDQNDDQQVEDEDNNLQNQDKQQKQQDQQKQQKQKDEQKDQQKDQQNNKKQKKANKDKNKQKTNKKQKKQKKSEYKTSKQKPILTEQQIKQQKQRLKRQKIEKKKLLKQKREKKQKEKQCKKYKQIASKIYNYIDALYAICKKGYTLFFTILTYSQIKQISNIPIIPIVSFVAALLFNLYIIFCMNYIQKPGKYKYNQKLKAKKLKAVLGVSKIVNGQKLVKLIHEDCDCCAYTAYHSITSDQQNSGQIINKAYLEKKLKQNQKISFENYILISNIGNLLLEDFLQAAYIFMVMRMSSSFYNYSVAGSVVVGSSALNGAGRIIRQVTKLQKNKSQPENKPQKNDQSKSQKSKKPFRKPSQTPKGNSNHQKNQSTKKPQQHQMDQTVSKAIQQPGEYNSEQNNNSHHEINPNSSVFVTKRSLHIVHQKE